MILKRIWDLFALTGKDSTFARIVSDSVAAGAELICGGDIIDRPGFYFQPTILDCSKHVDAPSVSNELFGPVLSVLEFDEEDEAVEAANQTPYGLAAGVFTTNLARAHRMSSEIKAGVVWVNTYRNVSPMVPFGGFGWSGHGREGGVESVLAYMSTKSVWLNTSDTVFANPFETARIAITIRIFSACESLKLTDPEGSNSDLG